ncbi:MAG: methyl-accepting chemotaxis protein [Gammaproteobacteria bacterium]
MKITQLTRLGAVILGIITVVFIGSVSWSLNRLNQAFRMVEAYGAVKEQVAQKIQLPIVNYLHTGDASLLTSIQKNIHMFEASDAETRLLNGRVKTAFAAMLETLERSLLPDLREAGKLSNPQVLLINNEQQLSGEISALLAYVEKANEAAPERGVAYLELMNRLQITLQHLSQARQAFFEQANTDLIPALERHLKTLQADADRLYALPRLGVTEVREQDEMAALMGWSSETGQRTDSEEDHLAEIGSLIKRYPKELSNAQRFIRHKITSRQNANQQLKALQETLAQLEIEIADDYQAAEFGVYLFVFACLTLIVTANILLILFTRRLASILSLSSDYINRLANGDLRGHLRLDSRIVEVAQLNGAVDTLQNYFNLLIENIHQQTDRLKTTQQKVIKGSKNLEQLLEAQQQSTESVSEQMEQLSLSYEDVAKNASETNASTRQAENLITQGIKHMDQTSRQVGELAKVMAETAQAMRLLQQDANAIEGVLHVIKGFTEQTNLLALNAAIEAARAGEQGRGFAVVADEVRKLSSHTSTSAAQIQGLVERLNTATQKTVDLMNEQQEAADLTVSGVDEVRQAFIDVQNSVLAIHDMSSLIASATEQQAAVTGEVSSSIANTAALARQSSTEATENKNSVNELTDVSTDLNALVDQFKQMPSIGRAKDQLRCHG